MNKKKLILFAGLPLLLLGGGGAFFALSGGSKDEMAELDTYEVYAEAEEKDGKDKEVEKKDDHVFYELPDIIVNLNTGGKRKNSFLKIKINLELDSEDSVEKVEELLPRIIDNLQIYLRELRVEDIQGSEGLYRLREELLHRVNMAANPAQINDILFAEMLMQ